MFRAAHLPLIFLSLCAACPIHAQVAPAPDAPPSVRTVHAFLSSETPAKGRPTAPPAHPIQMQSAPSQLVPGPLATLRVPSNLVNVFFVARGPHDRLVANLTQSNCAVFEDGTKQSLKSFGIRRDLPFTVGLLLDTSLSQQNVLATEQQAGDAFLRRILKPKDAAFLLSFDVDVDLLADVTASRQKLEQAMSRACINSSSGNFANGAIPPIGRTRGTLLYDAVYLASHDLLRKQAGRKALVLLTNGEDEGSRETLKSAIEAAQQADAIVYVLLISDPGPYGLLDFSGADAIRKLAKETGGRVFEIGHNGRKMLSAFNIIESDLRGEYEAAYKPANSAWDGTYRRIRVQCVQSGERLHVRARDGYYALRAGESRAGGNP